MPSFTFVRADHLLVAGPSVLSQILTVVQILFFAATGFIAALTYITAKRTIFQPLRAEVFKQQLDDLRRVLSLFIGKGEYDLQEDFAFKELQTANIAKMYDAYVIFAFDHYRPEEVLEYRHELCPTSMVLPEGLEALTGYKEDPRLPAERTKPTEWEYPNYEVCLPRAFTDKQKEFQSILDSPLLPKSIVAMLDEYLATVIENASIAREVIGECAREMPANYPTLDDIRHSTYDWIYAAIADKRKPLEPIAKIINEQARSYFDSDNLFSLNSKQRRVGVRRRRSQG